MKRNQTKHTRTHTHAHDRTFYHYRISLHVRSNGTFSVKVCEGEVKSFGVILGRYFIFFTVLFWDLSLSLFSIIFCDTKKSNHTERWSKLIGFQTGAGSSRGMTWRVVTSQPQKRWGLLLYGYFLHIPAGVLLFCWSLSCSGVCRVLRHSECATRRGRRRSGVHCGRRQHDFQKEGQL